MAFLPSLTNCSTTCSQHLVQQYNKDLVELLVLRHKQQTCFQPIQTECDDDVFPGVNLFNLDEEDKDPTDCIRQAMSSQLNQFCKHCITKQGEKITVNAICTYFPEVSDLMLAMSVIPGSQIENE